MYVSDGGATNGDYFFSFLDGSQLMVDVVAHSSQCKPKLQSKTFFSPMMSPWDGCEPVQIVASHIELAAGRLQALQLVHLLLNHLDA